MLLRSFVAAAIALPILFIPAKEFLQRSSRDLTREEKAAHVLNRLTFGARPGDLDRVLEIGVERWIEMQLRPESISDSALKARLALLPGAESNPARDTRVVSVPARANLVGTPVVVRDSTGSTVVVQLDAASSRKVIMGDSAVLKGVARQAAVEDAMKAAAEQRMAVRELRVVLSGFASFSSLARLDERRWLTRAEGSDAQLLEVMTDFWENHFSVHSGKLPGRAALAQYDSAVIRPRALGNFRDLLGAVARSPAMLFYLDNHLSSSDPDRMSLSQMAAEARGARVRPRAGTGINENYARELLELHTLGVDGGYTQQDVIEVARAFTGWTLGMPRSSLQFLFDSARHDAEEKTVLGHTLAAGRGMEDAEEVLDILARHSSTARFIAHKLAVRFVSDSPPPALVDRAAETFTRTDGDIREVVRTIVTSPEFFTRKSYRAKVKNHVELLVSMRRVMGAGVDSTTHSLATLTKLGQPLFGRATPDGWPETAAPWLNFSSMFTRVDLALQVARGEVPAIPVTRWAMWDSLAGAPFEAQVDGVVQNLLLGSVSEETLRTMLSARPDPARGSGVAGESSLRELIGLALSSPEFQRK